MKLNWTKITLSIFIFLNIYLLYLLNTIDKKDRLSTYTEIDSAITKNLLSDINISSDYKLLMFVSLDGCGACNKVELQYIDKISKTHPEYTELIFHSSSKSKIEKFVTDFNLTISYKVIIAENFPRAKPYYIFTNRDKDIIVTHFAELGKAAKSDDAYDVIDKLITDLKN